MNGVELCRRADQQQVFAITAPLITTADGKKMGKSEGGLSVPLAHLPVLQLPAHTSLQARRAFYAACTRRARMPELVLAGLATLLACLLLRWVTVEV